MKPATIVLIATSSALLGACAWASLVFPIRSQVYYSSVGAQTDIKTNLWGQPLYATTWKMVPSQAATPIEMVESGAFPNLNRQGRWTRKMRGEKGEWVESFHWYFDGREVTREEWERR
jgi:hypothetical protein